MATGPTPAIQVDNLRKTFHVPVRDAGLRAAVRSLVRRESREVQAVAGVSFNIPLGEVVGFLGPNGAGKTTTLKMLSGLLHPSSGEVSVLGHVPQRREREFLRRMTLVMGNRNQLQWDLPAADSFELNRAIYRIPHVDYVRQRDELVEVLDVGDLVSKPVRNLSLGERMKMEIVASLLHRPSVLFLDEPTIGLDVEMQKRIRLFVADYNRRHGACVLLTSHYMADVEALCRRVIVIHRGRILFDGQLAALTERFAVHKTIGVLLDQEADQLLTAWGMQEAVGEVEVERTPVEQAQDLMKEIEAALVEAKEALDEMKGLLWPRLLRGHWLFLLGVLIWVLCVAPAPFIQPWIYGVIGGTVASLVLTGLCALLIRHAARSKLRELYQPFRQALADTRALAQHAWKRASAWRVRGP